MSGEEVSDSAVNTVEHLSDESQTIEIEQHHDIPEETSEGNT